MPGARRRGAAPGGVGALAAGLFVFGSGQELWFRFLPAFLRPSRGDAARRRRVRDLERPARRRLRTAGRDRDRPDRQPARAPPLRRAHGARFRALPSVADRAGPLRRAFPRRGLAGARAPRHVRPRRRGAGAGEADRGLHAAGGPEAPADRRRAAARRAPPREVRDAERHADRLRRLARSRRRRCWRRSPARSAGAGEAPRDPRRSRASLPPALRTLLAADILVRLCEGLPDVFVVVWVLEVAGLSPSRFGILTSILMATAIVSYAPAVALAGRAEKKSFIVLTYAFFTAFPLAILLSRSFGALAVAFAIGGLREIGEPARKAFIVDASPASARGRVVGLYYALRGFAVAGAAAVGGLLWSIRPELDVPRGGGPRLPRNARRGDLSSPRPGSGRIVETHAAKRRRPRRRWCGVSRRPFGVRASTCARSVPPGDPHDAGAQGRRQPGRQDPDARSVPSRDTDDGSAQGRRRICRETPAAGSLSSRSRSIPRGSASSGPRRRNSSRRRRCAERHSCSPPPSPLRRPTPLTSPSGCRSRSRTCRARRRSGSRARCPGSPSGESRLLRESTSSARVTRPDPCRGSVLRNVDRGGDGGGRPSAVVGALLPVRSRPFRHGDDRSDVRRRPRQHGVGRLDGHRTDAHRGDGRRGRDDPGSPRRVPRLPFRVTLGTCSVPCRAFSSRWPCH